MKKLSNAPLQEVILEVRWDLSVDAQTRQEIDEGYELAQGKLQTLVSNNFPFHSKKIPISFPAQLLNYQIVHQFWAGKQRWPVLQLGPGIFTVNDTDKNYEWEKNFFPLINTSLKYLCDAYSNQIKINFCNLKYIDAVKINDCSNSCNILDFIKKNLKIEVIHHFENKVTLDNININQTFNLKGNSSLSIVVANGTDKNTKEPILIWQTAVYQKGYIKKQEILKWCEYSHSIISPLFKKMTKGEFYDSFK